MKPAARNVFLVVIVSLLAGAWHVLAAPANSGARGLLTTGNNDLFWSADVNPNPTPDAPSAVLTTIQVRQSGDQLRWQKVGQLAEAPTSLASRGSELLVVLADGEWKIVWASDMRS